ncbi:MAG: hypothetical protein E7191_05345 [Erysipelotrichaceae bacterium]|nr:hypothetical protein [Erysipelotrichaceae bacterium]
METKKKNQWSLDRAFSIDEKNETRLYNLLSCIRNVKTGLCDEDEAMENASKLGAITERGRKGYEKSTATLLKSIGLITDDMYCTTDIADAFLDHEISYKELILLQMIKKEYKYDDDSEIIHPFIISIEVLLGLIERDPNYAWIDAYDYLEILTEIKKHNEIQDAVDKVYNAHHNFNRTYNYEKNHDFDMWQKAFVITGVFKEISVENPPSLNSCFTLDIEEIEFAKWLTTLNLDCIDEYIKTKNEREEILKKFGSKKNGLLKHIPRIKRKEEIKLTGIATDTEKILELFLFEGKSYRMIDIDILGSEADSKGFFSNLVIKSLGVSDNENKGVWKKFRHYKNIVKLALQDESDFKYYSILFNHDEFESVKHYLRPQTNRMIGGSNTIYYGIPGCGKSYNVSKLLSGVSSKNIFRTTFYLDYSNADFVGQLVPKTDFNGKVTYEPNFGPFTKALKRAYETSEMVYLVIEEINRGNAAAIFGDIFQLLDRLDSKKISNSSNLNLKPGDSEYPITNNFIEDYLNIEPGNIIIPSNLTILATMNTSDQNVFPLDTAFKRRWNMEKVISNWKDCDIADLCVPFTDITWKNFAQTINVRMMSANETGDIIITEDKKMGAYFATEDMLVEKSDRYNIENKDKLIRFVTNVVDYLFNDVTKFSHDTLFKEKLTFDGIYESAIEYELSEPCVDFFLEVFKDRIKPDVIDEPVNTEVEQPDNNEQSDSNN